nr:934_t:CDS:2 [Entrophospora candida]
MGGDSVKNCRKRNNGHEKKSILFGYIVHRLSLDALDRDHYGKKPLKHNNSNGLKYYLTTDTLAFTLSHLRICNTPMGKDDKIARPPRNLKRKKERSESRERGGSVVSVGETSGPENECHLHWQDLKSTGYIDAEKEETLIIYMTSNDLAESREDNMVNEGPGTANAMTNDVSGNVKSKLHRHILIPM